MRKLFLSISMLLALQIFGLSAQDQPSWVNPANDSQPKIVRHAWWWPFGLHTTSLKESDSVHAVASSGIVVDGRDQQSLLQPIDCVAITKLQNKIRNYVKHDETLQVLHEQMQAYVEKIAVYNAHVANYATMAGDTKASFEEVYKNAQRDLGLLPTTIEQMNKHSDIMIATKNIDFLWQIKEGRFMQGGFEYARNLLMPSNIYSYFGPIVGTLGSLALCKNYRYQPNITITVQKDAHLNLSNNQTTKQDAIKMIGTAALVVGTTLVGMQLYRSWMYSEQSKEKLAMLAQHLQHHNNNIEAKASESRGFGIMHDVQQVAHTTQSDVQIIGGKVDTLASRTARNEDKLDTLVSTTARNHNEMQTNFSVLSNDFQRLTESQKSGLKLLVKNFRDGELKNERNVRALKNQQRKQHQENQEKLDALTHQTQQTAVAVHQITKKYADWLVQDSQDKVVNKKIINAVHDRLTKFNDTYTRDSHQFGKKLDAIEHGQQDQTNMLLHVLNNPQSLPKYNKISQPTYALEDVD